jgi:hypothetical protein
MGPFDAVKWQTDGALVEALTSALDCLEAGRVWGSGLLDCLDFVDVIAAELRYRGLLDRGHDYNIMKTSWGGLDGNPECQGIAGDL